MTKQKVDDKKKLEELGKAVLLISESTNLPKKTLAWNSFIRGLAQGFGAVIGGTVVVTFLVWILTLFTTFDHVPVLGHFIEVLRNTLSNK